MLAPETRPTLLLRIQNPRDHLAWEEFYEVYQPLILRLVQQRGLQESDAQEVTQNVLIAVAGAISRWEHDPDRGSFRGWLGRVARNLTINFLIRRTRHPQGTGDSDFNQWLDEVPDEEAAESRLFRLEHRRQLFLQATTRIRAEFRDTVWQAFWQTAVLQRDMDQVARECGLSLGALYVARSRVMKRLREQIETLDIRE